MPADLNFEAEPYGGFPGSHGEEEFETVMVRDHRGGGAPVVSGQRAGYPGGAVVRDHRGVSGGAPVISGQRGTYGGVAFGGQRAGYPGGTVVRDHRYGGTTVSVRPAASTSSPWSRWGWGGRGWGGWGGWGRTGDWGRWGGPSWGHWGGWGTPGGAYWGSRYYQPGAYYFGALTPGSSGYYPYGWRSRTRYWRPWLVQGGYGAAPSIGMAASIAEPTPLEPQAVQEPQTVAWAQSCLAQIVGPWVPQDGNLGPATQRAIQMFQTQTQLPASGALDDNTLIALQQACQAAAAAASSAAPSGSPGGVAMSPAPSMAPPSPSSAAMAGPPGGVTVSASPGAAPPGQTEAFDFAQEFGGPYEMEFPQEFGGPYETEFPQEFGGPYEMEAPKWTASERNLIAFKIPEAPYSDETFRWIHKSIDIFEAVHTTMAIFGVELAGLLGLAFEALGPLAAMVGTFFALGAGYAEARADISRRRIRSGFALGVVMGADGRKWPYVKRMFWEYGPEPNSFDPEAGRVAQKAFNTGLATGFLQGREIVKNPKKMAFFWDSISRSLTPGDRSEFAGDRNSWRDLTWRNWYITAGAKFDNLYLKD